MGFLIVVVLGFIYLLSVAIVSKLWKSKKYAGRMIGADATPMIALWPLILMIFGIFIWPWDFCQWLLRLRLPKRGKSVEVK